MDNNNRQASEGFNFASENSDLIGITATSLVIPKVMKSNERTESLTSSSSSAATTDSDHAAVSNSEDSDNK